jgi:hypothetical protein
MHLLSSGLLPSAPDFHRLHEHTPECDIVRGLSPPVEEFHLAPKVTENIHRFDESVK